MNLKKYKMELPFIITLIMVFMIFITACHSENSATQDLYKNVQEALDQNGYVYNGGDNNTLAGITFSGDTVIMRTFKLKEFQFSDPIEASYTIDDMSITIAQENEEDLVIPYTMDGDSIKLGEGYYSLDEVDDELQGCWSSGIVQSSNIPEQYDLKLENGMAESRRVFATEDVNISSSGPENYTIQFGGFETKGPTWNDWRFNIVEGKPTIILSNAAYFTVCKRIDELPSDEDYEELKSAFREPEKNESSKKDAQNEAKEAVKDKLTIDTGEKQVWEIYVSDGEFRMVADYSGSGNFIVKISDPNQNLEEVLCNEIGDYHLDKTVYITRGFHYLEINANNGSWEGDWYGTFGH